MEQKRFSKFDDSFTCAHCGREVLPLGYSSRNHCPFCLWSLHVDINPGDRANPCRGELEPVSAEPDPKKGYIIISRCRKCGELRRCKAAHEADVQPDDIRLIIDLTVRPVVTSEGGKSGKRGHR
ncbi:MAG: RNHCP domain-containing protein [Ruminococcaceae bacterium]|nr:RNHCP domain-containing protein [Oscillospiraceae bacterium]